ncbi:PstS family phosphate ABC transporter substrate-binding protein [Mangrovibacillus cuniculi]|uniref:Phosphate-binding protein n=1 Tax=Mangrovibacillus cuniculi TaxID=2593652 RepID=A0A7S8CBP2_9BACI|nr:PstS family phosphate ABC transporter substrate-binding protein [Mangrovibacillus cuniculi]QPC46886.1 PstS family phosphate ABC transporter substrate-binding protein [Mangrovibacillus cuniculi]
MKNVKYLAMSTMIGSALMLAACGGGEETSQTGDNGSENGGSEVSGTLNIDGSSTVYPIVEGVVEEFQIANPGAEVTVGFSGSGGGFEKLINGEIMISNASRPIKDEEIEAIKADGKEVTELELAYDGLSVVVNKENDWVDSLTVDELKKMWVDGGATTWADVREGWPEEEIVFYSPGTDSGTYDYFNEVVLEDEQINKGATLSEDDNVLVQGVTGDKNAIGFFGYAYYLENKDNLKVVPVDGGNGPVEPTNETIESGEYAPLSRPLYSYVVNSAVKEDLTYAYVKFLLENAGMLAEEVGYVSLPQEKYDEQLETIEGLR